MSAEQTNRRPPSTTAQSSAEYSGTWSDGLDPNASYDRMIFVDRRALYQADELQTLVREIHQQFQASSRSRMVLRVLVDPSLLGADLDTIAAQFPEAEIDFYPEAEGRFQYLTISLNREDREIPEEDYRLITKHIRGRVDEAVAARASFEGDALLRLARMRELGFYPTLDIKEEELTKLWTPFGWTYEAVGKLLRSGSSDIVMGMRSEHQGLVAVAMFNDQSYSGVRRGETTEWTTDPEFRKFGIMPPLLTVFHAYLVEQGISNIWADLRAPDSRIASPHSISPALKSGMSIVASADRPLSSNHVTIAGPSQSYNAGSEQVFGDTRRSELRTFVRGYVDRSLFTRRLIDGCLHILNHPA